MYQYDFFQWVAFFFVYCFIGWCFESTYVSLHEKRFVNRGYIHGPLLPLYGSGAIMLLFATAPFREWKYLPLMFLTGSVTATILEYVVGVSMLAIFKVRYWDYSYRKIQFQGHICLVSSLAWGGLSIVLSHFIHKPIEGLILRCPVKVLHILVIVVGILFLTDVVIATKAALDLRAVIIKIQKDLDAMKDELEHVREKINAKVAATEDSFRMRKDAFEKHMEEYMEKHPLVYSIVKRHPSMSFGKISFGMHRLSLESIRKNVKERLHKNKNNDGANKK